MSCCLFCREAIRRILAGAIADAWEFPSHLSHLSGVAASLPRGGADIEDLHHPRYAIGLAFGRGGTASLLILAALLKAYQLITEPSVDDGLLSSRWFVIVLVEYELSLGIWILSGAALLAAWHAAFVTFGGFFLYNLYGLAVGQGSCGCFGDFETPVWLALSVDGVTLTFLAATRRSWWQTRRSGVTVASSKAIQMAVAMATVLTFGVAITALSGHRETAEFAPGMSLIDDGDVVVLDPEKWIGSQFPLCEHIGGGKQLRTGIWTIVLYHHDCAQCERVVVRDLELSENQRGGPQFAFIEVPPYGPFPSHQDRATHLFGRLSDRVEWFVATPIEIRLEEGKVISVHKV